MIPLGGFKPNEMVIIMGKTNADTISFRWKQATEYSISNFENAIKDINWLLEENKRLSTENQELTQTVAKLANGLHEEQKG